MAENQYSRRTRNAIIGSTIIIFTSIFLYCAVTSGYWPEIRLLGDIAAGIGYAGGILYIFK